MGTEFSLYLYSESGERASAISDAVFEEIDRVEDELSNYRESSELSRINREAASREVTTDPETFRFLQRAMFWSFRSDGAFDITVGRLMKAWGFFRKAGRVPSDSELSQLRAVTGWKKMQLNEVTRGVRFLAPGVELDPGGIGKGFGVDLAVSILRENHVTAAMISAGSSTIYALGAPPGAAGWKVRVPGLDGSPDALSTVVLRDTSLSSANCREKHFVTAGHDYCHIMDPRTMRPVEGTLHVSVIDASATDSDALSNVLFVQTPEQSAVTLRQSAPAARALIVSLQKQGCRCTTMNWESTVDAKQCDAR